MNLDEKVKKEVAYEKLLAGVLAVIDAVPEQREIVLDRLIPKENKITKGAESLFDEVQSIPDALLKSKLLSALAMHTSPDIFNPLRVALDSKPLSAMRLKARRTAMLLVTVSPLGMYEAMIVASFKEDFWIGVIGGVDYNRKDTKGREWLGLQSFPYTPHIWGGYTGIQPRVCGLFHLQSWTKGYDKMIFEQGSYRKSVDLDVLEVKFNLKPGSYDVVYHIAGSRSYSERYDIVIQGETRRSRYKNQEPGCAQTIYFDDAEVGEDGILSVMLKKSEGLNDSTPTMCALEVMTASYDGRLENSADIWRDIHIASQELPHRRLTTEEQINRAIRDSQLSRYNSGTLDHSPTPPWRRMTTEEQIAQAINETVETRTPERPQMRIELQDVRVSSQNEEKKADTPRYGTWSLTDLLTL